MKKDIENIEDIIRLVNVFYTKVIDDVTIGYIFKTVANFSFEKHIPIMISFWETLLFGIPGYKGNPMLKHIELNKTIPLNTEHFKQWLYLWEETINEIFKGKNANEAIVKAKSIGGLLQYKINTTSGIKASK
ncbi:MAG: group III truncated hemoglobin [Ferruginibacter sp.]